MDTVIAKRIETELIGHEVGDWRIEKRIDQGKSAVVFRAAGDNGLTAVKVFDPEMVERYGKKTQLARIERELQLKGQHHPNLIQREFPRLCRGGSSSLTFAGVHPGNSER